MALTNSLHQTLTVAVGATVSVDFPLLGGRNALSVFRNTGTHTCDALVYWLPIDGAGLAIESAGVGLAPGDTFLDEKFEAAYYGLRLTCTNAVGGTATVVVDASAKA